MPDRVPVRCPHCDGDRWHLHPAPGGGLLAACTTCGAVMAARDEAGLTRAEVAAIFRVTPRTISRWRRAGTLTPLPTAHGVDRYRTADVRALLEAPGDTCPRGHQCAKHPGLADLLGHDRQGHAIIKALTAAGITTRAQLTETELRDVPGLGLTRIVLIHHRLGEAEATKGTRHGDGSRGTTTSEGER
jgi:transcriptional regulator with XRE-family HTH domain